MLTEVQCPKCHAKLRSANDLTGKSVRCKKCETRFRAGGESSTGESVGDTQALSVMEINLPKMEINLPSIVTSQPVAKVPVKHILNQDDDLIELDTMEKPKPKPAAKAAAKAAPIPLPPPAPVSNAFTFDEPAEKPKKKKKKREEDDDEDTVDEGSAQSVATLPDAGPSAFSFDDPAETTKKKKKRVEEDDEEAVEERPKQKKKRASDDDDDEDDDRPRKKKRKSDDEDEEDDEKPKYGNAKKGMPMMLILGIGIGVILLGGGGIVALLFMGKKETAKTTPSTTPVAVAQVPVVPIPTPTTAKAVGTEPTKPATTTEPTKPGKPPAKGPGKGPKTPPEVKGGIPKVPAATLTPVAKADFKILCDYPPESMKAFRTSKNASTLKIFLVKNTSPGFNGAGIVDTIFRLEGDTGANAGSFDVNADGLAWPRPFEASPDGKQILIEAPAGKLTLYDFEEKKKLLDGVDPFQGMANRDGPMKSLGWLADGKFFVIDKNSSIDIWNAAEKKIAIVGLTVTPKTENNEKVIAAAVGSSGKYVVSTRDNQSIVTSNGSPVIQKSIQFAENGAIPLGIAGYVTGEKVAYLYSTGIDQYEVAVGDTKTNPTKTIQLPADCGTAVEISWQSDDTLVVTIEGGQSALLIDVGEMIVVGYVKCPTAKGQVFARGMFPMIWWAIPDPKDPKKTAIAGAKLDFDAYKDMRTDAKLSRNIPYLVPREDSLAK